MDIALVSDVFPSPRSPAAARLQELAQAWVRQGHRVTVMVPAPELSELSKVEEVDGLRVVRLKAPQTEGLTGLRHLLAEFRMPFHMLQHLMKSPLVDERWDGVVWHSPSIFLAPIVNWLREESGCPSYLILGERFPDSAVDAGRMQQGLVYRFLKLVARQQCLAADTIGLVRPDDAVHFEEWKAKRRGHLEVLADGGTDRAEAARQIVDALSAGLTPQGAVGLA